jgi:hypothetical protein
MGQAGRAEQRRERGEEDEEVQRDFLARKKLVQKPGASSLGVE